MSTDRAREAWRIVRCPVCGQIAEDMPEGESRIEVCNGVSMGGRDSLAFDETTGHPSDHAMTAVEQFAVVPLDAAVEALRERGEFACGGFEKEAAAFLEAEFGVPQPEQPA